MSDAEIIKLKDIFDVVKRTEIILISLIAIFVVFMAFKWFSGSSYAPQVEKELSDVEQNVMSGAKAEADKVKKVIAQDVTQARQTIAHGAVQAGQAVSQGAVQAGQAVSQGAVQAGQAVANAVSPNSS